LLLCVGGVLIVVGGGVLALGPVRALRATVGLVNLSRANLPGVPLMTM